ncbi:hypothetical protein D3C72_1272550 [compost metagenome]
MQAEQGIAGFADQVAEQAFMGFAGQAIAVVRQVLGADAGSGKRSRLVETQLFGMAQVFQKGGNRGIAERMHVFSCYVLIGDGHCPDPTVTPLGGWLV